MKVPIRGIGEINKIRLKGTVVRYGERVTALNIEELEFGKGIHVVMGPNGAGKSTLLYLVSGMLKPTAGKVILNDLINIAEISARARTELRKHHYSILLQEDIFIEHISVYDNIALPFTIHGQPAPDETIKELSETFGIRGLLMRKPSELSGGEKRKVSIVRALVKAPYSSVILLDEPTSNLDTSSTELLIEEIKKKLKDKICLIATHDIEFAAIGDKMIKLRAGRVISKSTQAQQL